MRLDVRGLELGVGGGQVVLEAWSAVFALGEVVGIVGKNGAGKSTLLRALAGSSRRHEVLGGEVLHGAASVLGARARELAGWRAYLGQREALAFDYSVAEVVAMGEHTRAGQGFGGWRGESSQRARISGYLDRVGLAGHEERVVSSLSGGEQQRVMMARVLATQATWWMLDEPLVGLDLRYQREVCGLIAEHAARGGGVLWVCHDLNWVMEACTRVLVCDQGRIAHDGPPREVLTREVVHEVFEASIEFVEDDARRYVVHQRLP